MASAKKPVNKRLSNKKKAKLRDLPGRQNVTDARAKEVKGGSYSVSGSGLGGERPMESLSLN